MSRSRTNALVAGLALVAMVLASLPLVGGLIGRLHPAFDSFGHFRWHLSLALIGCSGIVLFTRFRIQGAAGMLLGLGALWTTLPGMGWIDGREPPADTRADARPAPIYRLLHLNLRFDNPEPALVLSLVGRVKPDVITLNEVATRWLPHIETLRVMYPHSTVCPARRGVGGVAILSRRPLAPGKPIHCSEDSALAIATIDFGGRWVDVAAIHLHWPWPFEQAAQIERLLPDLATIGSTGLLAGDLNAVTWSAAAQKISAASGAATVQGIGASWMPTRLPAWLTDLVGLPIDNVFTKGTVAIESVLRQARVGSDHLPVLVEFSLAASPGDDGSAVAMAAADNSREITR